MTLASAQSPGNGTGGAAAPEVAASGVYCIKNTVTGKSYVGSSCELHTRFQAHKRALRNGKHHSSKLQRAWDKYGEECFEFSVILICSIDDLLLYEQIFINGLSAASHGYNVLPFAGRQAGRVVNDETRKKISAANKGRKHSTEFSAMRSRIQAGVKRSDETKAKISASLSGRKMSELARQKLVDRVWSEESRERVRQSVTRVWAERNATKVAS